MRISAVAFLAMSYAAAAVSAAEPVCPPDMAPHTVAEMLFGRNVGEVLGVSEAAWAKFLDEEITPRFPDGLTVIDSSGQWRDPASGRVVREPGKILRIILTDPAALPKLSEIAAVYKSRFRQQSVIVMLSRACAAF
ncbi:MAG: DUF3574 domain-containing protein [Hyphomicrobiaceae bacterium]